MNQERRDQSPKGQAIRRIFEDFITADDRNADGKVVLSPGVLASLFGLVWQEGLIAGQERHLAAMNKTIKSFAS